MSAPRGGWSVAGRVFGIQLGAVLVITAALSAVLWVDARTGAEADAGERSLSVARTIAADPSVIEAVQGPDPTGELEPFALATIAEARVDYVTIMSTDGIRYTHPDLDQIGRPFLGTISEAQAGRELVETYTGTLGPSVRAVVPIEDAGELVAIVSAGVTVPNVAAMVAPRIPFVVGTALVVAVVGAAAAWLTRRSLARVTGRMRPDEMARMVDFYASVLHTVREGVVLTDRDGRVVLVNDEAAELLGLPPADAARPPTPPTELGVDDAVAELIASGRQAVEETVVAGGRVLLVNQEPVGTAAAPRGTVMTLRDQSRLQQLVGELESVRTMGQALRSQTHEFANRMHAVASLLELGRTTEALEFVSTQASTSQQLTDRLVETIADPVLGALLLGKSAQAAERGIRFVVETSGASPRFALTAGELVSVVGNVVDNALDAALDAPEPREVSVHVTAPHVTAPDATGPDATGAAVIEVHDSGAGVDPAVAARLFDLGVSTKPGEGGATRGVGLALVRQILDRVGGDVAVRRELDATVFALTLPTRQDPVS